MGVGQHGSVRPVHDGRIRARVPGEPCEGEERTGYEERAHDRESDAQYAPWTGLASRPMPGTPVEDGLP